MDKKFFLLTATIFFISTVVINSYASTEKPKRILKNNMKEVYNQLPEKASNPLEMVTNGIFYGRLRANYFGFKWDKPEDANPEGHNPKGFGLGGSMLYKTSAYYGLSATAGVYFSNNLGLLDRNDALYGKCGKDTFSRYDKLQHDRWGMTVMAQSYFQFSQFKTDIKVGRQIFESFFTASNDSKMIPNTFEGYSLESKAIPDTILKLAVFTAQKLREHTSFHDVITYGDGKGDEFSNYNNQDDSAGHKGINYDNLKSADKEVDNTLVIAGLTSSPVELIKLGLWYNSVPELFSLLAGEINVPIQIKKDIKLTPGIRYMQQFDNGAGEVGGAALNGSLAGLTGKQIGYAKADSVNAQLFAARLVLNIKSLKIHGGYSKIADKADLIMPWRAFPTAGYTRSMGQYNWEANTESWMVLVYYDLGKANIVDGLRAGLDYVFMNYDDKKESLGGHGKTDRHYAHTDIWYRLPFYPVVEAKVRFGLADADKTSNDLDPSYMEYRFEMNFLF